jgi:hypothetical protein
MFASPAAGFRLLLSLVCWHPVNAPALGTRELCNSPAGAAGSTATKQRPSRIRRVPFSKYHRPLESNGIANEDQLHCSRLGNLRFSA